MIEQFRDIVITGASSPIGRALAARFRHDNPSARITGVARRPLDANFDRHIQADLRLPPPQISGDFDLVIHAAAAIPSTAPTADDFDRVNVQGSSALFHALKLTSTCAILNLSTSSVYDAPSAVDLDESAAKTTTNPYGMSKLAFEDLLRTTLQRPGMTVLSLRIPVLLAPGVANNFVAGWLSSIRAGGAVTLFNPDSLLNALVDDEAIYHFSSSFLSRRSGTELTCNVSCRDPISVRVAARVVMQAAGRTVDIVEHVAPRPSQTINHALAASRGYQAPSAAACLTRFVRSSLEAETP